MTTSARQALESLTVPIPPQLLETVAQLTAQIMIAKQGNTNSPWMTRKEAADYLSVPVSRLEKDKAVPAHRWDGRVMYHREELDTYLLGLEAA